MPKRLGHGPFYGKYWPLWPWKQIFYNSRPDLHKSKTRPPQWTQIQAQSRYFQALFCYLGPPSHLLWNILFPFTAIMTVAAAVAVTCHYGHYDMKNKAYLQAFRLVSFVISLLISFRINRAYDRWREARSSVAGVGNGATTIFMQAATWIKDEELVDDIRRFCIVWPFAIMQTVLSEKTLHPVALPFLHPEELAVYTKSRKGRQVVVTKMRQMIFDADLPLDQFTSIETAIAGTWKSAGDALRIKFQAMPLGLSLLCTGCIEIFCVLLPFGLWTSENSPFAMLPMAVVTLLLLACDEMANQLENPFELMPMEDIMVTYERDINRVYTELQQLREAERAKQKRVAAEARIDVGPESSIDGM